MTALLVYPTHANLSEEEARYLEAEIQAVKYPVRSLVDTEVLHQNCWNEDADQAEAIGLPVVTTVCFGCRNKRLCRKFGYLRETIAAREAVVSLATHRRAATSGLEQLIDGREYIAIHEDALAVLRPEVKLSLQDLLTAREFLARLTSDPFYLDFYSDGTRKDDNGNPYHDQEQVVRRE